MKTINKKITEETVKDASFWKKRKADDLVVRTKLFQADESKEKRLINNICQYCFYLEEPQLAMQAFWEWNCGVCDKIDMASSSAVPKVCKDCCEKHRLCNSCGGQVDLNSKRKESIK